MLNGWWFLSSGGSYPLVFMVVVLLLKRSPPKKFVCVCVCEWDAGGTVSMYSTGIPRVL